MKKLFLKSYILNHKSSQGLTTFSSHERGFTFIEIILYISIITIMMGSLIPFAWNMIGNAYKSSVQQEVSQSVRILSERLKYEIRNATGIDTVNSNFGVNLVTNPSAKLTLNRSGGTTVITVVNGQVFINQGSAVALTPTGISVTDLTFTNYTSLDNKTKHVGFTLSLSSGTNTSRYEFKDNINMRSSAEIRSN